MLHQHRANIVCQNRYALKHGGKHRDPRCSLACRDNWAELEAALLIRQLCAVAHTHHITFGNIQIEADLTIAGHLQVRKRFIGAFRRWKKKYNCHAEFRAVSEIGPRNLTRLHHHYAVYSDLPLPHATMRSLWERACQPFPIILAHDPPKANIEAAAKYMFKDLQRVRERREWVWLFDYYTLPISWQSRGFFSPNRQAVLNWIKQGWNRKVA